MKQWNHPEDVEKHRKEVEKKRQQDILRLNTETLEQCIKKNVIDNLDRTKPYDKTFICKDFLSIYGNYYINDNNEMNEFRKNIEKNNIEKNNIEKNNIDKNNIDKNNIEKNNIDKKINPCSITYKFWSNFIPKNTFTNIGNSFVFRIDNENENNSKIYFIDHYVSIPCSYDDDETDI
jgi:hypothetical protein